MPHSLLRLRRTGLVLLLVLCGCRGGRSAPGSAPGPRRGPASGPAVSGTGSNLQFDAIQLYQQHGLLARGAPVPFVGNVSFLATPTADSTHIVIAISLANTALTFARENDRFRAGYTVGIALRQGAVGVRQIESHESVLVNSFRETSRLDESVIYQEIVTAKPGRYSLAVSVRDDGSSKASAEEVELSVPRLGSGSLSTPIAFAEVKPRASADMIPGIVVSPKATVVFGRDTTVLLYVEAYSAASTPRLALQFAVRNDAGGASSMDTASIIRRATLYSGVINVPVSRVGIGPAIVSIWQPGSADTTRAPVFVTFGEELPVANFEDMLKYLRYYTTEYRLKALRDAPPDQRAAAWAKFVKETTPSGGFNDTLHDYFLRVQRANERFREEGTPGWMSDRGRVLLGLGDPDQVIEQANVPINTRGRTQVWDYRSLNLQLVFYDQTGFGRWRMTTSSEVEFESAWRRRVN